MKNLFEQSRSHWVRYDRYELKTAADGKRYITPGKNAKPDIYNPLKEAPGIVLDALNVGMLMMNRSPGDEVQKAILEFVTHYGLLGLMTALPTTPSFMDYEAVYLPKTTSSRQNPWKPRTIWRYSIPLTSWIWSRRALSPDGACPATT